jgi:hypothetical protein
MEFITFDEEKHEYTNARTGEVLPSVTQIISDVYGTGLEGAPKSFVDRASKKGSIFHNEVKIYKDTGKLGESEEFKVWHKWFCYNAHWEGDSEKIVYAKTPYGSFAGTVDFFCNGWLVDWKTSKTATRKQVEKWQMQLSLYCYALRKMGNIVNEPLKIVHITDKVEVIYVDYLGDEWVEETVRKYYAGEKVESKPETSLQTVDEQALAKFGNVLKQIAELEKSIEPIREQIKEEMEKRKILALKTGNVIISYIGAHKSKKFDVERFKAENVDLYKQYTKVSEVKSSIRIKLGE